MTRAETRPAWVMAIRGGQERGAPRRWLPPRLPAKTAEECPARQAADRRHLARLDDRPRADVGLSREAVTRAGMGAAVPLVPSAPRVAGVLLAGFVRILLVNVLRAARKRRPAAPGG